MDKTHLNNHIFRMKASSKEGIRRMYQKLKKNDAKLNELIQKVKNDKKLNKIKNQIERSKEEKKLIKSICPDEVTKIALIISDCNSLINCNQLNLEERLKLRIAASDIVQKMVTKFKKDWPGSEQWIDLTIDLLDEKKIMKSYKNKELVKQLYKQLKQRRNILKVYNKINKKEQINDSDKIENNLNNEIQKQYLKGKSQPDSEKDNLTEGNRTEDSKSDKNEENEEENLIEDCESDVQENDIIIEDYDSDENEEDIVIEDFKSEESEEDIVIENYDSDENEEDKDLVDQLKMKDKSRSVNEANVNSDQKACEEYLKKQLVKAFGEEIAFKSSKNDVSSDEEWVDDFFINKKVKKFKPTIVDLERYKDLEEKEKAHLNQNGNKLDKQDDKEPEDTRKSKKIKKRIFSKKRKINVY